MSLENANLIMLDAEELAENGIAEAYNRILPDLKNYLVNPISIEEIFDPDLPRYAVRFNEQEHVIYSPDDLSYESWGIATYVFFKIINDQLADLEIRFYAINGGSDLFGVFLTPDQAELARAELDRPIDWPYLPEFDSPWYGQYH